MNKTLDGKRAQATQAARDGLKRDVLELLCLLSESARAKMVATMSATLDSQSGLLLRRDDRAFQAALAKLNTTGDDRALEAWLRKHSYLPLTDSRYMTIHTAELIAQERAQGGIDGE